MKFIISVILIMMLSFASCLYFPWWTIAIATFLVAAIVPLRALVAFIAGFIALFLLWGWLAWWISDSNEHILAHRVSLLILKKDNPMLLIFATALVGALVGGFAAMTGSLFRTIIYKERRVTKTI
jgi:hypothetical protein